MYRMRKETEMFNHVLRNVYRCMNKLLFFNVCYTASHLKVSINLDFKKTPNIILEISNDFFKFNVKINHVVFMH